MIGCACIQLMYILQINPGPTRQRSHAHQRGCIYALPIHSQLLYNFEIPNSPNIVSPPTSRMSTSNKTNRPVYLTTRTINEAGPVPRKAFKLARQVTGRNFSMLMHWSIVVDDSVFELGGKAKSQVHEFVKRPLTAGFQTKFQHEEVHGYTIMTDDEILSAGEDKS
jgi:hypothetical protein